MVQTRKDMIEILKQLQAIQWQALAKGIHTFEVAARVSKLDDEGEGDEGLLREYGDTEERFVDVTIFKTGDDTDEDYLSVTISQGMTAIEVLRRINEIKWFIKLEE